MKKYILAVLVLLVGAALLIKNFINTDDKPEVALIKTTPLISCNIVAQHPHDTSAYTEGLQVYNGKFYEGTGMEGESKLQISDITTGKVLDSRSYPDSIFGEGIQVFKNKIYQLTWKNHIVYVYDINNIKTPIKTFNWPYEGWGMTNNGTDLIISDGSSNLYFVNPDSFKVKKTIQVAHEGDLVGNLNELEYINGYIYANIWTTNDIVKIDASNGNVLGKIALPDLKAQYFANKIIPERTDVLNGIAYDSSTKKMYITGKRWPLVFEIEVK